MPVWIIQILVNGTDLLFFDFNNSFLLLFSRSFLLVNNSNGTESPYDAIQGIIKYYVLLGFLSIFAYWLAWSTWTIAAERQVRRIRFVIIHLEVSNL
jgi:hypothetical protein